MQVTETNTDGLKHDFTVVIPAGQIEEKVQARLENVGQNVRLPGFRPGKVPMTLLRKKYLSAVMGEVLEEAVNDGVRQITVDAGLRPAMQPKVDVKSFDEGKDLEFTVAFEALPEIKPMTFSTISIERMKAEVADEEIEKGLADLAQRQAKSEKVEEDRPTQADDVVLIDFTGRVDGKEFPGGKAEKYPLQLGSGSFIPGFEDQLIGKKVGDNVLVKVTFPAEYGNEELAGKDAEFDVVIHELQKQVPALIDDELARAVGLEDLEALRKAIREEHERHYESVARGHLKRELLDILAENHDFAVPQGMVDMEFDSVWKQIADAKEKGTLSAEDAGKSDDELTDEYRKICERRVRLGLLLSEVGQANNITVTQEDLNRALFNEARRFPGQERLVIQYYQKNPEAMASLRMPIFEDKVIDFIVENAKVSDKVVSVEELMKDPEEEKAEEKPASKGKGSKKKA